MRPPIADTPAAASRARRRLQNWLFSAAITALVVGTVAGVFVARDRARTNADRQAEQAADDAADAIVGLVEDTAVSLRGVGVVAGSGGLDAEAFVSFAADLRTSGFEAALTLGRLDPDGAVEWLAATSSVDRSPADPPARASEAVAAAIDRAVSMGGLAVSDLTTLVADDGDGVVVVRAILAGDGSRAPIGVVAADLPAERLRDAMRTAAGDYEVTVSSDGIALLGPAIDADSRRADVTAPVDLPGLDDWSVVVLRPPAPGVLLAALVAGAGSIATLTLVALLIVTSRHQRSMNAANRRLAQGQARTKAVQELAGRLAHALTRDDVVRALVDHLPPAVDARSASLVVVGRTGAIEVLEPEGASRAGVAAGEGTILRSVVQSGQAAWLSSPLAWRDDPAVGAVVDPGRAAAVLPLAVGEDRGAVVVAYDNVHLFGEDERALFETVGLLASRALARGRRFDEEHRLAVAFQAAALPESLPVLAGLTVAARYRPAARSAAVGGDWYDVVALDDHRVILAVGDVVGHGLGAAATMGRLRTAFRVLTSMSDDPGTLLSGMSAQVDAIPDAFCSTMVCAVVDTAAGELTWSRAGHPPPVLVGAHGTRLLDAPGSTPLGVIRDATPPVHRRPIRTGDRLLLYTDGLVERRGETLDAGFERLVAIAGDLADLTPDEHVEVLVEGLVPGNEQTDDVAVLIARLDGC